MFSMLSLIGGGLGGLLRFVPEIFKLINAKNDQKHELAMTQLQIEIDKKHSEQDILKINAQSDASEVTGNMAAFSEAIKAQGQLTGVKWVDAVNQTVRPFLTYWWMAIFTTYKVTVIYGAWNISTSLPDFGTRIWTDNDWATLSMIISFWFVDRVFHNHAKGA